MSISFERGNYTGIRDVGIIKLLNNDLLYMCREFFIWISVFSVFTEFSGILFCIYSLSKEKYFSVLNVVSDCKICIFK